MKFLILVTMIFISNQANAHVALKNGDEVTLKATAISEISAGFGTRWFDGHITTTLKDENKGVRSEIGDIIRLRVETFNQDVNGNTSLQMNAIKNSNPISNIELPVKSKTLESLLESLNVQSGYELIEFKSKL